MTTEITESVSQSVSLTKFLCHMRNPQNLLNYMIFTAYCKFMGVTEYLPSITIG